MMSDGSGARLHLKYCPPCDRWALPSEPTCPECSAELIEREASGRGTVFTYTVNHHPFNVAIPTPYVVAIVTLAEQEDLWMAANIVDCQHDSITVGMPVAVCFDARTNAKDTVSVPAFAPRWST